MPLEDGESLKPRNPLKLMLSWLIFSLTGGNYGPCLCISCGDTTKMCGQKKSERDQLRQKFRVNIGKTYFRWKALMAAKGMKNDAEVARYLLDSVCGKELSGINFRKPRRKRGRPPKIHVPQIEETLIDSSQQSQDPKSPNPCQPIQDAKLKDLSQASSETQSPYESGNVEVFGISYDLPHTLQNQLNEPAECEIKMEDEFDDVSTRTVSPSDNLNFALKSSTSSTITAEENEELWKDIKEEQEQIDLQPEDCLHVCVSSIAPSDNEDLSSTTQGIVQKEQKWGVNNTSLKGLFRTCHQCGDPVLEFKTLTSGNFVHVQWECSKGHLMWLYHNNNPT
ncbi:uncharacterized protein si:ch211-40k21.5 isoform X2 [Myxocyprinus asiaticus]|uniref:uncharacterized protein si:ch211-40k21.5 isoform X2 n=1 Tax=Myxocyprinus asiaticus TaxID=70543 RepID=UPI0022232ECE|nr:uncharacterized protein si:ch211-40k21.5 isoform X2 [Myxocyprinus asiaticus]